MAIWEGIVEELSGYESCGMSNIGDEKSPYFIGDFAQGFPVPVTGIATGSRHEDFGTEGTGFFTNLIVVQKVSICPHPIMFNGIKLARGVEGAAVSQVPTMCQFKAKKLFSRLEQGKEHGGIRLSARVGLDVDPFGAEKQLEALLSQPLHLIYIFAAAIIPAAGQSLGILVIEDGAERPKNSNAGIVFRSDEFKSFFLTTALRLYPVENGVNHTGKDENFFAR